VLSKALLAEVKMRQGQRAESQALRDQVSRHATMLAGSRILDPFIVVAKERLKRL
jgi:hypothetical protein